MEGVSRREKTEHETKEEVAGKRGKKIGVTEMRIES